MGVNKQKLTNKIVSNVSKAFMALGYLYEKQQKGGISSIPLTFLNSIVVIKV